MHTLSTSALQEYRIRRVAPMGTKAPLAMLLTPQLLMSLHITSCQAQHITSHSKATHSVESDDSPTNVLFSNTVIFFMSLSNL